jgi:hypothetical protein
MNEGASARYGLGMIHDRNFIAAIESNKRRLADFARLDFKRGNVFAIRERARGGRVGRADVVFLPAGSGAATREV